MKSCDSTADSGGCETTPTEFQVRKDFEFPGNWEVWLVGASLVLVLLLANMQQYEKLSGGSRIERAHVQEPTIGPDPPEPVYIVEYHETKRGTLRLLLKDEVLVQVTLLGRTYFPD